MAGERVKLVVQNRAVLGSAESRRLRRQGLIPGVLYGREEPVAIAIPERELRHALTGQGGTHAVLDVVVDSGKTHSSVLKEYQLDAVRGYITHVDLQEVRLDQPIHAAVSLVLVGEPVGVKEGGVLNQVTTTVNIEALPLEVPEHLELDVSGLGIGDSARLAEVKAPDGITILDDLEETVVASVAHARAEEEPEGEAAEGAAVPEGEEGADGETAEGESAAEDGGEAAEPGEE
ncbi:MAG TPA: 50S ribosomal protein L25 [Gaiellaceae bacterium]|nr:50S ribosomal protein L25 [Gaiellaceae bacterium]